LHWHLLVQARELATRDPRRPRQVNLRRAVSSAYYALFHGLIDQTCRLVLGTRQSDAPFRHVLGRAFTHGTMKQACTAFAGGTLKASVAKGLPAGFAVPSEVRAVARTFIAMQEQRHAADYDRTEQFQRSGVVFLVAQVDRNLNAFLDLAPSIEKNFFLTCLLAWGTLAGRWRRPMGSRVTSVLPFGNGSRPDRLARCGPIMVRPTRY
jgi:hypothetical protein